MDCLHMQLARSSLKMCSGRGVGNSIMYGQLAQDYIYEHKHGYKK